MVSIKTDSSLVLETLPHELWADKFTKKFGKPADSDESSYESGDEEIDSESSLSE